VSESHAAFSGSIPAAYDAYLGPLLFEFTAADIARRVAEAIGEGTQILEIACGTGISTQFLRERLPPAAHIVATDLNPGMLEFAREHRGTLPGVRYELADAMALPFEARSFDGVICQFGIMFFPDVSKGLTEMRRVLRPWRATCGILSRPIASRASLTRRSPAISTRRLRAFEGMRAHVVEAIVERPSAEEVARGFVEGNPGIVEIRERANAEPETIVQALADELERSFGPAPLRIPLREVVFTGHVPRLT
jgi:SAM-dependent methyltransferase